MNRTVLLTIALLNLGCLVVTGCDQQQKTTLANPVVIKKYKQATTLEGTVSNNKGVLKSGKVEASDQNGALISQTTVNDGHYRIDIPAGTVLPILLSYSAEANAEKLVVAVIHDSITKYDITPLTTSIAASAKAMGGYTHANLTRAAENTVHVPDANKTTSGWRGDPTTQYGGWH